MQTFTVSPSKLVGPTSERAFVHDVTGLSTFETAEIDLYLCLELNHEPPLGEM
jgi:hypothetical protein